MTSTRLAQAITLASRAHEEQVRRPPDSGPYILHPIRVLERVRRTMPDNESAQIVAVLHDVLEDTTSPQIERDVSRMLAAWEWSALMLLTHDKKARTYADYVAAIAAEPGEVGGIARRVKEADLIDNLESGAGGSLRARYIRALDAIQAAIAEDKRC